MDASGLRRWCLAQAGAVEDFPFGPEHSVFKVGGRMFALSARDRTPLEVGVECEPELAIQLRASWSWPFQLRASYAAIRPGDHIKRRHWNSLDGSLPDQLVRDLIEDSYDLVCDALPKRVRNELATGAATWPTARRLSLRSRLSRIAAATRGRSSPRVFVRASSEERVTPPGGGSRIRRNGAAGVCVPRCRRSRPGRTAGTRRCAG